MAHPYSNLPAEAYWRNCAGRDTCPEIWKPKFPIDPVGHRFASVGSCFANHIGARLTAHGLTWLGSRSRAESAAPSYDSFGLGNIYTPKSFLHWLRAVERCDDSDDTDQSHEDVTIVWDSASCRYQDLLIAKTWEHGFGSSAEARRHRRARITEVRNVLLETDILIFTLGLTEGWEAPSGTPYPICPAVSFPGIPAESYRFVKYDYDDVLRDLLASVQSLNEINPDIRLLLTVSPVPLVATASGDHVIAATTHSKSVLRAAAETCRNESENVDYFPSYELVVTSAMAQDRFSADRRSVTPGAIDLVMSHFFQAIGTDTTTSPVEASVAGEPDETCDEARYHPSIVTPPSGNAPVLIGSSQIRQLSERFAEPHLTFTMNASNYVNVDFEEDPIWVFKPTTEEFMPHWAEFTRALRDRPFSEGGHTIVTDIGCQSIWWTRELVGLSLKRNECLKFETASAPDIEQAKTFLGILRERHLRILQRLVDSGNRVVWIGDPPFIKSNVEGIESVLVDLVAQKGVNDIIRPRYLPFNEGVSIRGHDAYHGSKYYYAMIAAHLYSII